MPPRLSSNNLPTSVPFLLRRKSVKQVGVHQLDQPDKHRQLGRIQPMRVKCNNNNNNVDDGWMEGMKKFKVAA